MGGALYKVLRNAETRIRPLKKSAVARIRPLQKSAVASIRPLKTGAGAEQFVCVPRSQNRRDPDSEMYSQWAMSFSAFCDCLFLLISRCVVLSTYVRVFLTCLPPSSTPGRVLGFAVDFPGIYMVYGDCESLPLYIRRNPVINPISRLYIKSNQYDQRVLLELWTDLLDL